MKPLVSTSSTFRRRIIRPIKGCMAALALPAILAARAPHGKVTVVSRVEICVEKAAAVQEDILSRAEILAGRILALAGLEVDWRNQRRSCLQDRDPIMLNVTINTPREYFPRAYGIAFPFEGIHIRAFYDRIQQAPPNQVAPLLAHVLAHEIVHTLSGSDAHSETGVMKRRWTQRDLEEMVTRPLPFSRFDIVLLNMGIRGRHARLAAPRNEISVSY